MARTRRWWILLLAVEILRIAQSQSIRISPPSLSVNKGQGKAVSQELLR
jgi:hypothetical protein